MFYIGLVLIYLGILPLSEYVDDFFFFMGDPNFTDLISYNTDQIFTALILIIPGIILTVVGWRRPHKKSKWIKGLGIFLMIVGVVLFLDDDLDINSFYYVTFLGHLLVGTAFFIPGILIFLRERSGLITDQKIKSAAVKQSTETVTPVNIKTITPIDKTIRLLRVVEKTPTAQSDQSFSAQVKKTIELLSEIENEEFDVDEDFLNHIYSLSKLYLEVEDNRIQTEKSRKTLDQIEETFDTINEALENIYDRNFDKKADLIEEEILTLKTKLSLKGDLDSPFEKGIKKT